MEIGTSENTINYIKYIEIPLISVIIPVYNVLPYLREAIESVINQTYNNLEILIIDDGSTDGSGKMCDEYMSDPRVKVVHQDNRGLSAARNVGLNSAKGDIIAFFDPDDAFHPDMIKILVEEMKRDQADIVVCDFSIHDTQDQMPHDTQATLSPRFSLISRSESFQRIYYKSIDSAPWNKLYTRKIWEGLRFPEGSVFEGTYCIYDIFNRAKHIAITGEKYIMHRNRPGSICNTDSLKYICDAEIARFHCLSFIEKYTPKEFSYQQLNKLRWNCFLEMIAIQMKYTGYLSGIKFSHLDQGEEMLLQSVSDEFISKHANQIMKICYSLLSTYPTLTKWLYIQVKNVKKIKRKIKSHWKLMAV